MSGALAAALRSIELVENDCSAAKEADANDLEAPRVELGGCEGNVVIISPAIHRFGELNKVQQVSLCYVHKNTYSGRVGLLLVNQKNLVSYISNKASSWHGRHTVNSVLDRNSCIINFSWSGQDGRDHIFVEAQSEDSAQPVGSRPTRCWHCLNRAELLYGPMQSTPRYFAAELAALGYWVL